MEGAVTLWMPDSWTLEKVRHPYQRTYREDKKARWETDENYCNDYVTGSNCFQAHQNIKLYPKIETRFSQEKCSV